MIQGCNHIKSGTAAKMQRFLLVFNETPCGSAVAVISLAATVVPWLKFFARRSLCCATAAKRASLRYDTTATQRTTQYGSVSRCGLVVLFILPNVKANI